jgi:hypothetical protein
MALLLIVLVARLVPAFTPLMRVLGAIRDGRKPALLVRKEPDGSPLGGRASRKPDHLLDPLRQWIRAPGYPDHSCEPNRERGLLT